MISNDMTYSKSRESDRHRNATIEYPTRMRATPTITVASDPSGFTPTWGATSPERSTMTGTAPSDGYTSVSGMIKASAEL